MMKKITLLIMLLTASFGFSQALPFDFTGTLHGFIGDGNVGQVPALSNGSGNDVLQITAVVGDWDNAQVTFAAPIDLSDAANNTLRFTIQSTTAAPGEIHQHGVSFQGGGGALEANFQTTGTDVLNVELNFNAGLTSREKLVIFTDVGNLGGIAATPNVAGTDTKGLSGTYIIDNISIGADPLPTCTDGVMNGSETGVDCGGPDCAPCLPTCSDGEMNGSETGVDCGGPDCGACPSPPTTAATNPPARDAGDVASIFTNAVYADVNPSNGFESFGGAVYEDVTIVQTNDTKRITFGAPGSGGQYLYLSNGFDLTNFTHVHIDIYIESAVAVGQVLTIQLINQPGTGDSNLNTSIDINAVGTGAWYSADIELDSFNGLPSSRGAITLVQLVGAGSTYGPLYFDNFYFYKALTAGVDDNELTSFSVYPNPTEDSWNVKSKSENISTIKVYDILGKSVMSLSPNSNEAIIDGSSLKSGLYFARINTLNGSSSLKLIKN
jgi:hypothetical protein